MTTAVGGDPEVQRLWYQLEEEEQNAVLERKRLQEIWLKVSAMHRENEERRIAFENEANFKFVKPKTRMVLNVGGQLFETTAEVLCRDRFSLLAALCVQGKPPVEKDESGSIFLDRDWWIFRYILQFLRTGALPQDPELLKEMHAEASFYRLNSLRRAVEQRSALAARPPHPSDEPAELGTWGGRAAKEYSTRLGDRLLDTTVQERLASEYSSSPVRRSSALGSSYSPPPRRGSVSASPFGGQGGGKGRRSSQQW